MPYANHLFVCTHQKSGVGRDVAKALKHAIKDQGLKAVVANGRKLRNAVQECDCLDRCKHCKKGSGAALVVYPEGLFYGDVHPKDCAALVREHLGEGRPLAALLLDDK
ncbi:ferredoxin [Hymenobacter caeli]|uniref:(2Fe-2S) ferredoxin n=1 Tax=Hymenobacter caeli TaxID=2735894 RepID=A0ABX2FUT3_9BACT|nr:(2Fe-2S) ferredoxin domain-containing protein [Hymenobacter caeli]NRT20583.1 (2Fe-2S) ferredoxin [Hymenobacter caeli]